MSSKIAYRGLFLVFGMVAVGAVGLGLFGLFTVLTGGTGDSTQSDVLGEFACDSFDGDPAIAHESEFENPPIISGASEIERFDTNLTDSGWQIDIHMAGPLINASASEADGTEIPVERFPDENRIRITNRDTSPFRLFIDSISDGTAVRTQNDICPPELNAETLTRML